MGVCVMWICVCVMWNVVFSFFNYFLVTLTDKKMVCFGRSSQ